MPAAKRRLPSYVWRNRHGTYYFRAVIPDALRDHERHPREFRRSLQTDSWREAILRARAWRVRFDAMLERLAMSSRKRRKDSPTLELGLITFMTTAPDGTQVKLETDWSHPNDLEAFKEVVKRVGTNEPRTGSPATSIPGNSPVQFTAAFDEHLADHAERKDLHERTVREYRHSAALFAELQGNPPLAAITAKTVVEFRGKLFRLPANSKKRPQYRDYTATQLIDLDVPEGDRLDRRTVQKHIERLSSFFRWCVKARLIATNPAEGAAPRVTSRGYVPFEPADLDGLFAPATWQPRSSYAYWLPLLGLFTGGRIGELCQLTVDDVVESEGVHVLRIVDDPDEGKTVKTDAARRIVPIHSTLLTLGFLDYVAMRKAKHQRDLFPGANSKKASSWFARHRERCGVGRRDRKKVFHSFRKNVATALARAGVRTEHIRELIGHEQDDVTFNVYVQSSPPALLQQHVEQLRFDVSLEHLKSGWRQLERGAV